MGVRRIMALLVAVWVLVGCSETQMSWWVGASRVDQRAVSEYVIRSAAAEFGVDADTMVALARCESSLNPGAKNRVSSARGLFQYLDSTWARARTRLFDRGIDPVPYGPDDDLDPVAASRVTANVIAEGGWWWSC